MKNIITFILPFILLSFSLKANSDSLYVVISSDSLTIWHINAYRHCGAEYRMTTEIHDKKIVITEKDNAPALADCYCYFNMSVTYYNLEAGDYIAIVKSDTANEEVFIDSVHFSIPLITTPLTIFSSEYQSGCFDYPTSMTNSKSKIPNTFELFSVYPNPFNPSTNITFHLTKRSFVELIIYDVTGRKIETLFTGELKPGLYKKVWNGSKFASGIYLIHLQSNEEIKSSKLLLIK
jgi:hypothetical protein